jgi:hypothetical protein
MANDAVAKFNALMQEYVDKSYDELFEIASQSLSVAMDVFNKVAKDGNGAPYVVLFISTVLAMDGKFTDLEYKFLNDLLGGGVDYNSAKANVQSHYNDEAFDLADKLIDACPTEFKSVLLMLVTCFAAVDKTITVEEARYIAKLLID